MRTGQTNVARVGVWARGAVGILVAILLYPCGAAGQEGAGGGGVGGSRGSEFTEAKAEAQQAANRDFLGIRFGIAFGMAATVWADDRVEEAEVVEGIVRVNKTTNHQARVLLETHYFWRWKDEEVPIEVDGERQVIDVADIGIGPFAAIQSSGDEILEAIGMGVMVGFKRDSRSSFNVGGGVLLDPAVKTLADGIRANEPLPPGESAVRFQEEPRWGLLVLASFSF